MGAQNKTAQSSNLFGRVVMIKSSYTVPEIEEANSKQVDKTVQQDETAFRAKFKNFDFQYIQTSNDQTIFFTKNLVIAQLQKQFSVSVNGLFLLYHGNAFENGDWKLETIENPEGDRVGLQEIVDLWNKNKPSPKLSLYIIMDSSYSGSWCERLPSLNQRYVSIFTSCNQYEICYDCKGSLFFNCLMCNEGQFQENYKILTKYQSPTFINNSKTLGKLKEWNMKLLHYNILSAIKMQSLSEKKIKIYENGQRYEGEIVDGIKSGQGTLFNIQGKIIYRGEWQDSMPNGRGTMFYDDGTRYDGLWKNSLKSGKGVKYFVNGVKYYEGQYLNDKANGKGILYHGNGIRKYQGQFVDNKMNGKGVKFYENGNRKYEGELMDNKCHGKGIQYYENGTIKYEGDFINNNYNGTGVLNFNDEQKYVGDFVEGNFHGNGIQYYANGEIKYQGQYRRNKKCGRGVYFFQDGDRYEGQFKDDKKDGFGICYRQNGQIMYEGECKGGKANGKGVRYYQNGQKYSGEWKDNLKHGQGTLYDSSGIIKQEGQWENDIFIQ